MRDPWPESIRRLVGGCHDRPAHEVLASDGWADLRRHCGDLAVELDALGHRTVAQRVDRDYARLHEQLREAANPGSTAVSLLRADAIAELSSTLAAIQRFQAKIVAADEEPASHPPADPEAKAAGDRDLSIQPGGPEPDPHDTRKAIWVGKRIYLGDDTQVSRLFWLLARPLGVARTLGEVQRAVDRMETDRDCRPDEVKKAGQRIRKAMSRLRAALREAKLDQHVIIVAGGPREVPEYTMVWRFTH